MEKIPFYSVSILKRVWLTDEVFELTCRRPEGFGFIPGQYVTLAEQGEEREYTILSSPNEEKLRFLIKQVVGGKLSGVLASIALNKNVGMSQAKGYLTFRPTQRPVFFVATGVGVAPYVAMAAAGIKGFTLIHGARSIPGFFYQEELMAGALQYIPCISGNTSCCSELPFLYRGYVTDYLKEHLQPGLYDFYLCGSMAMIRDVTHFLDQFYPETRIYSEAYS